MTLPRPCIGCGTPTRNGTRCTNCQADADRQRDQQRGTSSSRGLGWAFTRRKQKDEQFQSATTCWRCGQPFTALNPKTAGHAVARSRGGHDSPILAECRRCNSSDGGRLAHQ